jgi:LCP family protein required for cell wall assembly
MLVKFKRDGQAQMLSIPRDLWVDIPGQGKNKINAAYAFGGPSLMVQTIKQNLGVEINHYVEINFVGFMAMIDDLGGIEIAFPNPARDLSSGLDVDAGMQRLDGKTALAYARSREYQELQGGQWVGVDASDIGRTQRQQEVIRAILTEIKSPSTITEAGSAASSLARHTTVDSRLASSSVAQLAWDFRAIVGGDIEGVTLPVVVGTEGNASVVYRDDPAAQTVIDNFKAGRPFADQPTRVQVLNGNGVAGAAGDMARRLELEGFDVVDLGDAPQRYDTTTILAHQGTTFGNEVRSALGFGEVVASDVDNRYDVVVIVGSDAA